MRSDEEFHELTHRSPEAIVGLVSGRLPPVRYRARSLSLKRTRRELDVALVPEVSGYDCWHLEAVGYRDEHVERTLFEKAVLAASQHQLWGRTRTGVIYLRDEFARAALPPVLGAGIDLAPVRIVLERLAPADLLRISPELFPLLPLCDVSRESMVQNLSRWWRSSAHVAGDQRAREEMANLFSRFFAARYPEAILSELQEQLEAMMAFRDTRIGRDLLDLGRAEGHREDILDALKTRFGTVPRGVRRTVQQESDLERLRSWVKSAWTATDLDEFRASLFLGD